MNTSTQPANTNTERFLRREDSQKSKGQGNPRDREALDKALMHPTRQAEKPFTPSRVQGRAITGATTAVALAGALVTASIGVTPLALFFAQR